MQHRAPSLNGAHPQRLWVPLNRLAAPGGGGATGRTKARKDKPFTIMHWNAESVMNKTTELEHILHEENINICCIQETHLQSNKYFKVRGYQCFKSDRTDRSKGGILALVRNNTNACLIDTHMEDLSIRCWKSKQTLQTFSWLTSTAPTTNPCLSIPSAQKSPTL